MSKTVTQAVEELVRAMVWLSDEDMGRPWEWGEYKEEGLRFALLMTHHEVRDFAVRLVADRKRQPTQTQRILAQYHQAYRDLTAVLAAVRTEDLDRAPAEGEWPLRETLKHMLGAEYGFLTVSRLGFERHRERKTGEPPDDEWNAFRAPYAEARDAVQESLGTATIDEARAAFFDVHVRVLYELGDIADDEIEAPAWFWDGSMPLRFRLHRFEEHLRQHTIQLDKTLVAIGRAPSEAQRLVRNIYNALADVEIGPATAEHVRVSFAEGISKRAAGISAVLRAVS